jgi:DNA end-binding protein Ku
MMGMQTAPAQLFYDFCLDLAKHIVNQKAADFDPEKFEDHYEEALTDLINTKRNGKTFAAKPRPRGENVVDLMDALKKSIAARPLRPKARSRGRPPQARRRCFLRSKEKAARRKNRLNPKGRPDAARRDRGRCQIGARYLLVWAKQQPLR